MYLYFPSPDINELMYYLNNRMCYLQSFVELIKYLHPTDTKVPEHIRANDIFRSRLTYTKIYINDPGNHQPEF